MKYVSQIMTAASGKVRGLVASHNRGGTYFRGKTIPTNPRTAPQQAARARLSTLIARFRSVLTSTQRTGWATFAANTNAIDALGNTISLTGPNWYVKSNSIRMQGSLSTIDTASTIFALSTLSPLTATVTANAGTALVGWNAVDDWQTGTVTAGVMLYFSRPQNPTVNFFEGPFQFAGKIQSAAAAGTVVVTLPFNAGTTGTKLFLRAVASAADGRPSSDFLLGSFAV